MKMNIKKLQNRLKGWHKTFRGRFLLLHNKVLTNSELILWDLSYSVLADWDIEHVDTYGSFDYTQDEIGWFLRWDKSTVSRNAKTLFKLHFWKVRDDSRIQVSGYDIEKNLTKITKDKGVVDLQKYIDDVQHDISYLQQDDEVKQQDFAKENSYSHAQDIAKRQHSSSKVPLVSFKGESSLVIKDDYEYQKAKARVEELEMQIGANFLSEEPVIKQLVNEHQKIAGDMLMYEIENDLLPI